MSRVTMVRKFTSGKYRRETIPPENALDYARRKATRTCVWIALKPEGPAQGWSWERPEVSS